jgi:hypothetical protein
MVLALFAISAPGCKSGMESIAILWQGYDIPPDCDSLQDQKVAVVCKTVTMEELGNSGNARQLAEAICERLKTNNKKIKIIPPEKVARLIDEKGLDDPIEIGKQLKAEKVLAIDIESFRVLEGQTLYRGHATISIKVYDVATKEQVCHKRPSQFEWPTYGPTPMQEMSEAEFRNKFIDILSQKVGRYFYPHDRYAKDEDER